MQTKEKAKMCPHCEGSIPIDAIECRYCGSSLQKKEGKRAAYPTEDSLASLYEPPYAPNRKTSRYALSSEESYTKEEEEEEETEDLFRKKGPISQIKREKIASPDEEEERSHIGSLLLLSIGGHLFTLAWLQFFFSHHGMLILSWKSRYWPIYLLISLPFIYHGWKKLKK